VYIPNAVSSGQDPFIGDQGATTGVIKAGATLVLERYLKYEGNKCLNWSFFSVHLVIQSTIIAKKY